MGVGGEPGQTIQVGARSDLKHEGKYLGQISLEQMVAANIRFLKTNWHD